MRKILKSILDKISAVMHVYAGIGIVAGTFIACFSAISRYLFKFNPAWSDEVVRMCMLSGAFGMGGYMLITNGNISLSVIVDLIKNKKALRAIEIINMAIAAVLSSVYMVLMFKLWVKVKGQKTLSMLFPRQLPYALLLIGFIVMTIQTIIQLILMIMGEETVHSDELKDYEEVN